MIKELLKVNAQVNRILSVAEEEDTEFPTIVGDLSAIKIYDQPLGIHIVLGIIDEFIEKVAKVKKDSAMAGFDEDIVRKHYDRVNMSWNNTNKVN